MYGSYIKKNWRKRHKNMHLFSFWAAIKPAKWLVEKNIKQFTIDIHWSVLIKQHVNFKIMKVGCSLWTYPYTLKNANFMVFFYLKMLGQRWLN